jgi:hypothetical protein
VVKMFYSRSFIILTQCLAICGLLIAAKPVLAFVEATLDRSTVYEGESFTLTITSDAPQRSRPNLSPLEKDFYVLGSGSSQQVQVINGAMTARTSWNIELQAKGTGQFHIPSLRVGKELTNPIQINVSTPPEVSAANDGQPVFIEVETSSPDNTVYLQQQVLYTVRLVFKRPLLDGKLSSPAPNSALIEQLGEDNQYNVKRGGESYSVIERRYAIFPEKSGQLTIPPIRFSGRLTTIPANKRRPGSITPGFDQRMKRFFGADPFGDMGFESFFDRGQPVTLQSKAIDLNVLPRPSSYTASHWLPAAGLELVDNWAEQPPEFKVGEPVSRTISIKAKGLVATLLPKLEPGEIDGVSIYPEQPIAETRTDGTWVYGQSNQSISYIPSKAGALVIPELKLAWWDTEAGMERTAVLPKWTIDVLPGKDLPVESVVDAEGRSFVDEQTQAASIEEKESTETLHEEPWTGHVQKYWQWLLVALLATVMLSFYLWRRNNRSKIASVQDSYSEHEKKTVHTASHRELELRLQKACSENDARLTADILLQMAAIAKPENPPKTLPALAAIVESGSAEIYSLDRFLYASGEGQWDGKSFYQVFNEGLVFKESGKETHESLSPLYPS